MQADPNIPNGLKQIALLSPDSSEPNYGHRIINDKKGTDLSAHCMFNKLINVSKHGLLTFQRFVTGIKNTKRVTSYAAFPFRALR